MDDNKLGKTLTTLTKDIYDLFDPEIDVECDEEALDAMAENMKDIMRVALAKRRESERKLRLSQVGKPDRQVWMEYHGMSREDLLPNVYVKFLYGNLIEEMVLFLAKQSGHEVRGEQDECVIEEVKGHRDAVIDNVTVDVKSASSYAFKAKFKTGDVINDHSFGYPTQLSAYVEGNNDCIDREAAWLAMDKVTGELHVTKVAKNRLPDARKRVIEIKEVVEGPRPGLCYQPQSDGASGNMKLAVGCAYCPFKHECFPGLRTFIYSTGPKYLTHVAKLPKVPEVT